MVDLPAFPLYDRLKREAKKLDIDAETLSSCMFDGQTVDVSETILALIIYHHWVENGRNTPSSLPYKASLLRGGKGNSSSRGITINADKLPPLARGIIYAYLSHSS